VSLAPHVSEAVVRSAPAPPVDLVALADERRRRALPLLERDTKRLLGQFMTPAPIAEFMAGLFRPPTTAAVRLLDPGAGVGSLTAAFVQRIVDGPTRPAAVSVTAYEVDPMLAASLRQTLADCAKAMAVLRIDFRYDVLEQDFVDHATLNLRSPLFDTTPGFTHVITNPPYKKITRASDHRRQLSLAGIEVSNLYAAFIGLSVRLLVSGGELVAITPRSFCNGTYFRSFRRLLLIEAGIDRVHTFEARDVAFRDDEVLQENIIYHAVKGSRPDTVELSQCRGLDLNQHRTRNVSIAEVVHPGDPSLVLHLPSIESDSDNAARMRRLACSLDDLGLSVSTGPVVDFRLRAHIRAMPSSNTVPLIYPAHFHLGVVSWPRTDIRKPNAIERNELSQRWLMPSGCYVLTKRFTSKEERRRIVAVVFDRSMAPSEWIGFENHVNVLHERGSGMLVELAWGLATYLNSSFVDRYFRSFNGHTQVNAGDLRLLRYPSRSTLCRLGQLAHVGESLDQAAIDQMVDRLVRGTSGEVPQSAA
jgi:adenine-specific DNA-methyltransferase